MYSQSKSSTPLPPTISNLSQAIFTVNRHAKAATNPKFLYLLKKTAIEKMISEGKAKKVGLHFSRNPKLSQQQSDVLIRCGDYSFHIPPTKEDFRQLTHLGDLDNTSRNPRSNLSLNHAKQLLQTYTSLKEDKKEYSPQTARKAQKPVFKKLGDSYF